ncbi:uncharacterized protein LOC132562611 [Ylistrum balloti]|uniref:uncharacterized protein LOC132562611 n=1 Tax=Ylistrum balloti TaxID=509963 RepID=UPI002905B16D|nr:uncharacterized protein LOC132562611 [Ylistrum balloti]
MAILGQASSLAPDVVFSSISLFVKLEVRKYRCATSSANRVETENRSLHVGSSQNKMSAFRYVRPNLFTLGMLTLIIGFSTSNWRTFTVNSSDNVTYIGHEGLWQKVLSNDSVSCSGYLGYHTDSHALNSLHTVRNLLAVAIGTSFLLLIVCSLTLCLQDDDNDDEEIHAGCAKCLYRALFVFILLILVLVLAGILMYDKHADISSAGEFGRKKSWSVVAMIVSLVFFGLSVLVCDQRLLNVKKTFPWLTVIGVALLVRYLYDMIPEQRRCRHVILWCLHVAITTLFSVGLFGCTWFSMSSTRDSNVTVDMAMWFQCRYQYSLTCCSGTTYFYTDIPGWFFTCRDITMVAYALCLLALTFSSILMFIPTFRTPLFITQICSGVALVVSCVQYIININSEADVHLHFRAAFIISVVVAVTFICLYLVVVTECQQIHPDSDSSMTEPLIPRSNERVEDWSWRKLFILWKERLNHRKSRMEARNSVNETECDVCMMNPKDTRLHPCGHTCCRVCAEQQQRCHMCRGEIEDRHIFYL